MTHKLFEKILTRLAGGNYLLIPRQNEGIIQNGEFTHCDLRSQVLVNKDTHFIIEKGKYRISLRNKDRVGKDDPVGMYVIDNTQDSYDKFWGSEDIITDYLCSDRVKFFNDVISHCREFFNGRLIEIGCGSGDFLKLLSGMGFDIKISGIDFSESAIRRCNKLIPSGEFTAGNIYDMNYTDGSFDVAICMEVLEHLEKPEIALKEIRRICRKGGIIIITIPNGVHDDYLGHLNFWSDKEFRQFLGDAPLLDFRYLEEEKSMLFIIRNN